MDSKPIYCLKCRDFTDNLELWNDKIMVKGRERMMDKAVCTICGKKKNRFVKMQPILENVVS